MTESERAKLEQEFKNDMEAIYENTKRDLKINSTRFLQMIRQYGGVEAAKRLIGKTVITDGITEICLQKRWDLLVESYVLQAKYHELFSDEDRAICKKRLEEYGWMETEI